MLRDLGMAMCKRHRSDRACIEFRQGQELLQRTAELPSADADALASLAGTWRGTDDELARSLYRRAYEADPGNPYPLGNYLEMEIARQGTLAMVPLLVPSLRAAILRCHDHASVGMNMPWAFYDMGKLHLLLDEPFESLDAYARGVAVSTTATPIESALQSISLLDQAVGASLPSLQWVRRFLLVAAAAREIALRPDKAAAWSPPEALREMATGGAPPIVGPVVILAGWTDPSLDETMGGYRDLLREVFSGFSGTIISGGTTAGICGIAGEIGEASSSATRTIGYLPSDPLPADAVIDPRYTEIRRTGGHGFSPLDPLQNWIDLLASGIDPAQVAVIGINGGRIAAVEYRIALALGARVAVVEESGRAAARLISGEDWARAANLLSCPADAMTLRAFLRPLAAPLASEARECLARAIHDTYRQHRVGEVSRELGDWETLPDTLKASNAQQADDMLDKLRRIGCRAVEVQGPGRRAHDLLRGRDRGDGGDGARALEPRAAAGWLALGTEEGHRQEGEPVPGRVARAAGGRTGSGTAGPCGRSPRSWPGSASRCDASDDRRSQPVVASPEVGGSVCRSRGRLAAPARHFGDGRRRSRSISQLHARAVGRRDGHRAEGW